MDKLNQIIQTEPQISSFLLNQIQYIAPPDKFKSLRPDYLNRFKKSIQLILELGEIEHTSDWDPYFIIILQDNTEIITPNGYHEIEITETSISIEIEDPNDEDNVILKTIPINDIKSISIND